MVAAELDLSWVPALEAWCVELVAMYQGGELRGEELRVAELVEYLGDALHGKCQADGLEVAECQGASIPVEELRVAELAVDDPECDRDWRQSGDRWGPCCDELFCYLDAERRE